MMTDGLFSSFPQVSGGADNSCKMWDVTDVLVTGSGGATPDADGAAVDGGPFGGRVSVVAASFVTVYDD